MAAEHLNSRILPILWFVDGCWLDGDIFTGCQERDSQDGLMASGLFIGQSLYHLERLEFQQ